MRWFYVVFPLAVLAWVFLRGRQLRSERGHLVRPPHDLHGDWAGDGWLVRMAPDRLEVLRPDGSPWPIDAVIRQTYKRGYVVFQTRGIRIEKLALMPVEMDEQRFTKLKFAVQMDVKTLHLVELRRQPS